MRRALAAAGVVVVMAASAAHAQTPAPDPGTRPAISASPNPVPHGPGAGKTTITWTTGNKADAVVRVSTNRGIEQVFGSGPSGSSTVDWIASDKVYEFRLYSAAASSRAAPLATVRVTRQLPPVIPTISAQPNPIRPGTGLGTTTIGWSTGDRSDGEVFVSENGGPERLFAKGPSGSLVADWIDRTAAVEFRLYSTLGPRRQLASVRIEPSVGSEGPVVAGTGPPQTAVLAAHPNPVPAGFGTGRTLVSWDVGNRPAGRLFVSVNGGPATPLDTALRGARHAEVASGSVYEFRLYGAGTVPLASIIVTRRDPYPTLFWITLGLLLVVSMAFAYRVRRSRARA